MQRQPQQNGYIESFNGSLRDECLNEEKFDTFADFRQMLALWRYDYNNVRPHSSLGNKPPAEARRALELFEGTAPARLPHPKPTTINLKDSRYDRGTTGGHV